MIGILLATHEEMGIYSKKLVEMLVGERDNFEAIGFVQEDSLDILIEKYETALLKLSNCEHILILTDIKGGSPCNVALTLAQKKKNIDVIAGFNVPFLLYLLDMRHEEMDLNSLIQESLDIGRESILQIKL